jgi:anti-anti-sigma factor
MIHAQVWKGSTFTIERAEGKAPGTVIFRLTGPFTARDMYGSLTPAAMRDLFDSPLSSGGAPAAVTIFDLAGVPYMDSAGLGMIVGQYARCHGKGVRMFAAGVSPRVMELFKITKVDTVIPMAATVEAAEAVELH